MDWVAPSHSTSNKGLRDQLRELASLFSSFAGRRTPPLCYLQASMAERVAGCFSPMQPQSDIQCSPLQSSIPGSGHDIPHGISSSNSFRHRLGGTYYQEPGLSMDSQGGSSFYPSTQLQNLTPAVSSLASQFNQSHPPRASEYPERSSNPGRLLAVEEIQVPPY